MRKFLLVAVSIVVVAIAFSGDGIINNLSKQESEQITTSKSQRTRARSRNSATEEHVLEIDHDKKSNGGQVPDWVVFVSILVGLAANFVTIDTWYNSDDDDVYLAPPVQRNQKLYHLKDTSIIHYAQHLRMSSDLQLSSQEYKTKQLLS